MPPKDTIKSVDITPSWSALVPVFVGVLQNPGAPATAHHEVEANLTLMAGLADKYVQLVKQGSGDTVGLTPQLRDPDRPEQES